MSSSRIIALPNFLKYMNKALKVYSNESKVSSISGWFCPHNKKNLNTFFLRGSDIWGWATWRRCWNEFDKEPKKLLKQFDKNTDLIRKFNLNNSFDYYGLLKKRSEKINQSWGILWNASNFLKNKYYLNFSNSLCINIGQDQSGFHGEGNDGYFNQKLIEKKIFFKKQNIDENSLGEKIKSLFFKKNFPKQKINVPMKIYKKIYSKIFYRDKIISYSGPFTNWQKAIKYSKGYDNRKILNEVLKNTLISKNNLYFFERDGSLLKNNTISYTQLGIILDMIMKKRRGLNIVDYGGSLGSNYFKIKDIIDQKYKNTWNIIEQKAFVNLGKKKLGEKNFKFLNDMSQIKKKVDIFMLSGTLQYLENPHKILKNIFKLKPEVILLERLPMCKKIKKNNIYIQKRGSNSYPSWIFLDSFIRLIFKKNRYFLYKTLKPEFDHNLYLKNEKINFCGYMYKRD